MPNEMHIEEVFTWLVTESDYIESLDDVIEHEIGIFKGTLNEVVDYCKENDYSFRIVKCLN